MTLLRVFFICIATLLPFMGAAHEFWIEPDRYQIDNGQRLQGNFKNGENFKGSTLSYFDRNDARYEMAAGSDVIPITPRSGDRPALDVDSPAENALIVVVHETTPSLITYREWPKFLKFAAHKDFKTAEADHIAAGWPQEQFRERYTRHAKALIAVGTGEGSDRAMGLKTEFVALTNPYADDFDGTMRVLVTLDGAPRADAQVEVFAQPPEGEVQISLYRTDAEGMAAIPVQPGYSYLFDAVTLAKSVDTGSGDKPILWETYWAALTFAVPQ